MVFTKHSNASIDDDGDDNNKSPFNLAETPLEIASKETVISSQLHYNSGQPIRASSSPKAKECVASE